eukprot:6193353-Pleurochrysis_carterae.AAC.4
MASRCFSWVDTKELSLVSRCLSFSNVSSACCMRCSSPGGARATVTPGGFSLRGEAEAGRERGACVAKSAARSSTVRAPGSGRCCTSLSRAVDGLCCLLRSGDRSKRTDWRIASCRWALSLNRWAAMACLRPATACFSATSASD